jgi:hypothetical protein
MWKTLLVVVLVTAAFAGGEKFGDWLRPQVIRITITIADPIAPEKAPSLGENWRPDAPYAFPQFEHPRINL